jgi:hypothetical protein
MLLHMDGSQHRWFQDEQQLDLIVILDDATSEIDDAPQTGDTDRRDRHPNGVGRAEPSGDLDGPPRSSVTDSGRRCDQRPGVTGRIQTRPVTPFQNATHDPLALTGALITLSLAVVVAGSLPALSASRIDPMTALRHE